MKNHYLAQIQQSVSIEQVTTDLVGAADAGINWANTAGIVFMSAILAVALIQFLFSKTS